MADQTKIEWTDATWNPVTGCTLVDEGCRNCYAADLAATRLKNHPSRKDLARKNSDGIAKFTGEVRFNKNWLDDPLKWTVPRKVFVCAHSDLFHENVPLEWIDQIFAVMMMCPQHQFQVLTKRPDRMANYLSGAHFRIGGLVCDRVVEESRKLVLVADQETERNAPEGTKIHLWHWPLKNVWLGTSVSDQASADARIPDLLTTPAAKRFVSAEPLLGPVDFRTIDMGSAPITGLEHQGIDNINFKINALAGVQSFGWSGLDWIIVGGESGRNARPMHPDWARAIRDQCVAAGTAFFFKQWGEWVPVDYIDDDPGVCRPAGCGTLPVFDSGKRYPLITEHQHDFWRVGKKAAGRFLDCEEWNEVPE